MAGWIKLHRKITEHPIFHGSDDKQFKFWLLLLLNVNHKEKRLFISNQETRVLAGQKLTSIDSLLEMYNRVHGMLIPKKDRITFQNCRTYLKRLEKWGMIKQKTTNKYRIIEVVNWSKYQAKSMAKLTSNQQATNKQLTTNKKDKNVKKNIYKGKKRKPSSKTKLYRKPTDLKEKDFKYVADYYEVSLEVVKDTYKDMVFWFEEVPSRLRGRNCRKTLMNWIRRDKKKKKKGVYADIKADNPSFLDK